MRDVKFSIDAERIQRGRSGVQGGCRTLSSTTLASPFLIRSDCTLTKDCPLEPFVEWFRKICGLYGSASSTFVETFCEVSLKGASEVLAIVLERSV